jgi:hypothetical protein
LNVKKPVARKGSGRREGTKIPLRKFTVPFVIGKEATGPGALSREQAERQLVTVLEKSQPSGS